MSAEEYCSWHQTGRFQNLIFQVDDKNKKYYAYDFKNQQRLARIEILSHGGLAIDQDEI